MEMGSAHHTPPPPSVWLSFLPPPWCPAKRTNCTLSTKRLILYKFIIVLWQIYCIGALQIFTTNNFPLHRLLHYKKKREKTTCPLLPNHPATRQKYQITARNWTILAIKIHDKAKFVHKKGSHFLLKCLCNCVRICVCVLLWMCVIV